MRVMPSLSGSKSSGIFFCQEQLARLLLGDDNGDGVEALAYEMQPADFAIARNIITCNLGMFGSQQ